MLRKLADLDFILEYPHRSLIWLVDKETAAYKHSTAKNDILIIAPHQCKVHWFALFDNCLARDRIIAISAHTFDMDRCVPSFPKVFDFEQGGLRTHTVRNYAAGETLR